MKTNLPILNFFNRSVKLWRLYIFKANLFLKTKFIGAGCDSLIVVFRIK